MLRGLGVCLGGFGVCLEGWVSAWGDGPWMGGGHGGGRPMETSRDDERVVVGGVGARGEVGEGREGGCQGGVGGSWGWPAERPR